MRTVLRRAAHAYLMELRYSNIPPNRAEELDCYRSSACWFSPLARTSNKFRKAALSECNADWILGHLRHLAIERSDNIKIEGRVALVHPRDYVPVARFYRGLLVRRKMEGVHVFSQFHRDFQRALSCIWMAWIRVG